MQKLTVPLRPAPRVPRASCQPCVFLNSLLQVHRPAMQDTLNDILDACGPSGDSDSGDEGLGTRVPVRGEIGDATGGAAATHVNAMASRSATASGNRAALARTSTLVVAAAGAHDGTCDDRGGTRTRKRKLPSDADVDLDGLEAFSHKKLKVCACVHACFCKVVSPHADVHFGLTGVYARSSWMHVRAYVG